MMMREWVYKALFDVLHNKTYSNLYLKDHLQEVDAKDQALAANIFYGTLQNYDLCRYAWSRFARSKVDLPTAVLLTMSTYQLLFLDKVPDYAIINDANAIARRHMPNKRGLINALLRKAASTPMEYPADPIKALALKNSLPDWLISLWVRQYSPRQAFSFAAATTRALPVIVRINPLRYSLQEALDCPRLKPLEPEKLQDDSAALCRDTLFEYLGNNLAKDPLYTSGKISAQDPGSYEIARWADVRPGQSVLDLCAAPGTKTMAMAELAGNQASFTACDLHEHRTRLIEKDAGRLGLDRIETKTGDSSLVGDNPKLYDVVVCDVPCSGFGVLGRKPDMKQSLSPRTIDSLLPVQKQLLDAAGAQTRPGGTLIYSTCTLNKRENEKQVQAFLQSHPDFILEKEKTVEPGAYNGGFYISRLHRNEEQAAQAETVSGEDAA